MILTTFNYTKDSRLCHNLTFSPVVRWYSCSQTREKEHDKVPERWFYECILVCSLNLFSFVYSAINIRLVGGEDPSQGRIEIQSADGDVGKNPWGTICNDQYEVDNKAATVICRQLGYLWGVSKVMFLCYYQCVNRVMLLCYLWGVSKVMFRDYLWGVSRVIFLVYLWVVIRVIFLRYLWGVPCLPLGCK